MLDMRGALQRDGLEKQSTLNSPHRWLEDDSERRTLGRRNEPRARVAVPFQAAVLLGPPSHMNALTLAKMLARAGLPSLLAVHVTATIPVMNQPVWNCCVAFQQALMQLRGLRASDLDQLQRRQKAAEWSNVISEGPDWSSCASESGAMSSAALSDAFADPIEQLSRFDDVDDDWRDGGGEEESLTARSNCTGAGSSTAELAGIAGGAGGAGGACGASCLGQSSSTRGCDELAPAQSPTTHTPQRQPPPSPTARPEQDGGTSHSHDEDAAADVASSTERRAQHA